MARALLVVLDSVGIGGGPDAASYFNGTTPDTGADTLGHIAEACARGEAEGRASGRSGPLHLPNLVALGLGQAAKLATGHVPPGLDGEVTGGQFASAIETSKGKDTPSGHYELCGLPVRFDWGYFPDTQPSFPPELISDLVAQAALPGILGDKHASGTTIIAELGEAHVRSGKPICYTSADSVFQIAAHEESFGLERLYEVCQIARKLVDPLNIGRVIARPFTGQDAASFQRTANRKDLATPPPGPTLLTQVEAGGGAVHGVGKISDIFAGVGITRSTKASGLDDLMKATLAAWQETKAGDLVFPNFVDFDAKFGHRRDVPGYAAELEAFDARLPELLAALGPDDLLILTADHGNDPTWVGTDHTREQVPVLLAGARLNPGLSHGTRQSFADVGQTLAKHLGLKPLAEGQALAF